MGLLILSLVAAFIGGLVVSTAVYVTADPNESLSRVAATGVIVSVLAGFACGFFFSLGATGSGGANLFGPGFTGLAIGVLSALVAIPTFFVVFFAGEVRRHIRSQRTTQIIPKRFRRGPRPTIRRRK